MMATCCAACGAIHLNPTLFVPSFPPARGSATFRGATDSTLPSK